MYKKVFCKWVNSEISNVPQSFPENEHPKQTKRNKDFSSLPRFIFGVWGEHQNKDYFPSSMGDQPKFWFLILKNIFINILPTNILTLFQVPGGQKWTVKPGKTRKATSTINSKRPFLFCLACFVRIRVGWLWNSWDSKPPIQPSWTTLIIKQQVLYFEIECARP